MSNLSVTISSVSYPVLEVTPVSDDTADGRSVLSFDVIDTGGLWKFQPGQPVVFTDSNSGYTFTGSINDSTITPLPPSVARTHTINCIDGHYLPDKRYYAGPEYTNRYAGDITTDLIKQVLASEGLTAAYAVDNDQSVSDWSQGTLTGTIATNTIPGGDIELALAGAPVTYSDPGIISSSNYAIQLQGTSTQGYNNNFVYRKIWAGSQLIATGDSLSYDVWINPDSPQIMAAVDFVCTDGTTFRDSTLAGTDAQGILPHPKYDLSGFADQKVWYHRGFGVSGSLIGKTISYFTVAFEGDTNGTYTAWFRNIQWVNGATVKQHVLDQTQPILQTNTQVSNNGYSNVTCATILAYDGNITGYTTTHSVDAAKIVQSSIMTWVTGTQGNASGISSDASVLVETSIDNGSSWQVATNNAAIPNLLAGMNVSGRNIQYRQSITLGKDPTVSEYFVASGFTINPSYTSTKTDKITTYDTQTDFNTGTVTNTKTLTSGGVTLNGFTRNYDDANYSNQTLFGNSAPFQAINLKTLYLNVANGTDAKSRMDFVGNWQNFTAELDVQIPGSGGGVGLVYRTTNWGNNNDTYAYSVTITVGQILFAKGSNSTGTGAFTQLASVLVSLSNDSWHRLKIIINGSNHQVYLDDVQYVNATDATYSATGGIGIRFYNSAASPHNAYFDNFGVYATSSGTWVSPSIDISGPGTYGNSMVEWDTTQIPNTTSIGAETSIDGGSTWQAATNGGSISGLSSGASLAAKTLKLRMTLTGNNASSQPTLGAVTAWVMGQFSSSGTRVSEVLPLNPVGRIGSDIVEWNGVQPNNTSIFVDTSLDGVTFTQVGNGASGSTSIAGITQQTDPAIDQFITNTSGNYTSTYEVSNAASGPLATWTWDTANSRLTGSGGGSAILLYNTPVIGADVDLSVVMDTSANGGFAWRFTSQGNFYFVIFQDSGNTSSPNAASVYKVVSGVRTQIGSGIGITFTRGTPHAFRVTHIGSSLTITMDGTTLFNLTENSLSAAGLSGLHTDGFGGSAVNFYAFRQQFYGQDVTSVNVYSRVRLNSTDPTITPQVKQLSVSAHDTNIQNGALIPQTSYSILNGNKMYIDAILDDLAKQSGPYWWKVKSGKVSFQQHQATPAPWVLTGNDILVQNITLENTNDHYRNSEWVDGGIDTLSLSKSFVGDSKTTTFYVDYPIDSLSGNITVNGTIQTVGVKGETGKQWYYKQGDTSVLQDTSIANPLDSTQTLYVPYNGQTDITVNLQRPSEIARMKALDGSSGIVEASDSGDGKNKSACIGQADGSLSKFARKNRILSFQTLRSGLAPGMLQSAFITPLSEFAGAFLILEVKADWSPTVFNGVKTEKAWYTVTGVDGPITGDWSRWISNLSTLPG